MLDFLLLRGSVPNRVEILVSSQDGDMELLLPLPPPPVRPELLVRPRARWWRWWLGLLLEEDENLRLLSCEEKSLEKKQPSSVVLAALKGPGELVSPNTLVWSLSSVMTLLKLLSLEMRRP